MAEVKAFNLGDAFGTAAKGLSYLDYGRKRREERENRAMAIEDRKRGMQAQEDKKISNAQKDMDLIMSNIDMTSPTFDQDFNKAMGWVGTRNPQIARKAYAMSQRSPEEKKMFIENLRRQGGVDGGQSQFERGKPFVNKAGERVVPIYDTTTQKLVRTETLGDAEKKNLPLITWTDEQIDFMADKLIATGEKPMKTRGKEANYLNQLVEKRAAEKQLEKGVGGAETAFLQKDRKAIQGSIAAQEKQRGSMVSFVANLSEQVDHVKDIASEIQAFDTRFLNKPLRWVKKKLAGNPQLSKYEVYLGEIQSEIGKLSSGSTASIAELSQGAREKWESILDENLSINDMVQILEEVKEAGNIRMKSVDTGLRASRAMLRKIGMDDNKPKAKTVKTPDIDFTTTSNADLEKILKGE